MDPTGSMPFATYFVGADQLYIPDHLNPDFRLLPQDPEASPARAAAVAASNFLQYAPSQEPVPSFLPSQCQPSQLEHLRALQEHIHDGTQQQRVECQTLDSHTLALRDHDSTCEGDQPSNAIVQDAAALSPTPTENTNACAASVGSGSGAAGAGAAAAGTVKSGRRRRSSTVVEQIGKSSARGSKSANSSSKQTQTPIRPAHGSSSVSAASKRQDDIDTTCRPRLTPDQTAILEEYYSRTPRPSTQQKKQQAIQLGLTPEKVNNWFQNRRAKSKQQNRARKDFDVIPISETFLSHALTSQAGLSSPLAFLDANGSPNFAQVQHPVASAFHFPANNMQVESPQLQHRQPHPQHYQQPWLHNFEALARAHSQAMGPNHADHFRSASEGFNHLQHQHKDPRGLDLSPEVQSARAFASPACFAGCQNQPVHDTLHGMPTQTITPVPSETMSSTQPSSGEADHPMEGMALDDQSFGSSCESLPLVSRHPVPHLAVGAVQPYISPEDSPSSSPFDAVGRQAPVPSDLPLDRESDPSELAVDLKTVHLQHPLSSRDNSDERMHAAPDNETPNLAVRRNRPRPAALIPVRTVSANFPHIGSPSSKESSARQPNRRANSANSHLGVVGGRVQKLGQLASQKSPLNVTSISDLNGPASSLDERTKSLEKTPKAPERHFKLEKKDEESEVESLKGGEDDALDSNQREENQDHRPPFERELTLQTHNLGTGWAPRSPPDEMGSAWCMGSPADMIPAPPLSASFTQKSFEDGSFAASPPITPFNQSTFFTNSWCGDNSVPQSAPAHITTFANFSPPISSHPETPGGYFAPQACYPSVESSCFLQSQMGSHANPCERIENHGHSSKQAPPVPLFGSYEAQNRAGSPYMEQLQHQHQHQSHIVRSSSYTTAASANSGTGSQGQFSFFAAPPAPPKELEVVMATFPEPEGGPNSTNMRAQLRLPQQFTFHNSGPKDYSE